MTGEGIGLWLEIAPLGEEVWQDFMIGIFGAEISAFGTGPPGVLPKESTLHYPMLGIRGNLLDMEFFACAARNTLDSSISCFCKVDGIPKGIFIGPYPGDDGEESFCRYISKF